jgi:hypothetical protein
MACEVGGKRFGSLPRLSIAKGGAAIQFKPQIGKKIPIEDGMDMPGVSKVSGGGVKLPADQEKTTVSELFDVDRAASLRRSG